MEDNGVTSGNISSYVNESTIAEQSLTEFHIEVRIGVFVILSLVAFLIIWSNIFAIAVICSSSTLRNVTGYMMISLAVSDLGMGFSTALPLIHAIFTEYLTSLACDVIGFLNSISWVVSVFTLTLLSIDRYVAILHPLHYKTLITPVRSCGAIAVTWILGAALWVLPLANVGRFKYNEEETACYFDLVRHPSQWISYSVLVFVPSSAIIIFCYFSMWKVSIKQRNLMEANMTEQAIVTYRKNIKPIRTLILIIGAFYVAWLPFFLEHLIKSIYGHKTEIPDWLEISIFVLAVNNSFWNPLIYMRTNSKFSRVGRSMLNKVFPCCKKNAVEAENATEQPPIS